MRRIMSACALALVLAVPAFAAKVDTGKLQLPDDLTQAQAEQVMAGALVKAVEQGVPMNIAIVDAGGEVVDVIVEHPVYGQLTGLLGVRSRYDVAEFNMSTADLGAASQPGQELYGIEVTNGGLVIFGGGELLKNKDGVIIGAIGVSGGSVAEDTNVAKAGVAALNK